MLDGGCWGDGSRRIKSALVQSGDALAQRSLDTGARLKLLVTYCATDWSDRWLEPSRNWSLYLNANSLLSKLTDYFLRTRRWSATLSVFKQFALESKSLVLSDRLWAGSCPDWSNLPSSNSRLSWYDTLRVGNGSSSNPGNSTCKP